MTGSQIDNRDTCDPVWIRDLKGDRLWVKLCNVLDIQMELNLPYWKGEARKRGYAALEACLLRGGGILFDRYEIRTKTPHSPRLKDRSKVRFLLSGRPLERS